MPIGKNIKKDTLIPTSNKKVKAKKTVKRKAVVKKKSTEKHVEAAVKIEETIIESFKVKTDEGQSTNENTSNQYIVERKLNERQRLKEKFDSEIKGYSGKVLQLVTFPIGNEKYAVDIDTIKEVVPVADVSKIPHAPSFIKGISNIRGDVMLIIDLKDKFELNDSNEEKDIFDYSMVIKGVNFNAGILLSEVPTTLKVNGDNIVSSAGLLSHTALDETFIKGLIKTDSGMVIYLDIRELIEDDDLKMMTQAIKKM